jgi:hypothetical protein
MTGLGYSENAPHLRTGLFDSTHAFPLSGRNLEGIKQATTLDKPLPSFVSSVVQGQIQMRIQLVLPLMVSSSAIPAVEIDVVERLLCYRLPTAIESIAAKVSIRENGPLSNPLSLSASQLYDR